MVTGFILPAIAAFLLVIFFKAADGFDFAKGVATIWLVLALILFGAFSWASTVSMIMILLLIVGLVVAIAYALAME
jgi:hypothetical protein